MNEKNVLCGRQADGPERRGAVRTVRAAAAAICLCLALTAGCARSGFFPAQTGGGETAPEYESYRQNPDPVREQFEQLCQQIFREQVSASFINLHYSLVNPAARGLTDYDKSFGDFSLASMRQERQKQKEYLAALGQIDPGMLDQDQLLTYRILSDALKTEAVGDGLELYEQPLAPDTGIQAQLPVLLGEFAFRNRQDVEDYLTLLGGIDEYYRQILEFEKEKSDAGLFMTDDCVDQITSECDGYLLPADHNFMTTIFNQRIDALTELTDTEKADYKARNQAVVEESFIPAYQLLTDGLRQLKGTGVNDQGLCYFPKGTAYYEYLVHSSTGTSYSSIEALRDAIEDQVEDDLLAMSDILKEHPELADQVSGYQFSYTDPSEILTHLSAQAAKDFPSIPQCSYVTRTVPQELSHTLGPAFFLVPPIDGYDQCVIYINPDSTSASQALYTTLAHEGIPGHMYQNVYFLSSCKSDLRKILSFTSYSEGWAFYVENYAYTTDNGLSPELGQILAHNAAASLGLHALIDININYFGWSREQVGQFLQLYFGEDQEDLTETIYTAMLSSPVNYLDYYVGYLEILHMRDLARETLGNRFSLKSFHQFLLDIGPAPFTVIRDYFRAWLLTDGMN